MTSGHPASPTYNSWKSMWQRCTNPGARDYERYGDRGITVCTRWKSFENFIEDMGLRPAGRTIDRIDNNKGYSKNNCRWATNAVQGQNRRNTVLYTLNGETHTLLAWSKKLGIPYTRLHRRHVDQWPVEKLLSTEDMRK